MKAKIVYVITDGEYSDYHVKGVALTEEAAASFVRKYGGNVEEYPDMAPVIHRGYSLYFIRMNKAGDSQEVKMGQDVGWAGSGFDVDGNFYTHAWAKDLNHAVKIANERRVQIVAEDRWRKSLDPYSWAHDPAGDL